MDNHEELPMADQDEDADQQVHQSTVKEGVRGGEQISLLEEERQGDQFEYIHDNQDVFSDRGLPQEMMGMQEPEVRSPDEVGTLPDGRGEPIDPTMEQVN